MILTPQLINTPIGFAGFSKFGGGVFGWQAVGIPVIVSLMPGQTKDTIEQSRKIPQQWAPTIRVAGNDVTGSVVDFTVQKLGSGPGSATIVLAGIPSPSVGDSVEIQFAIVAGSDRLTSTLFSGVVDSLPPTTAQPGTIPTITAVCREPISGYALARRPVTPIFTGSAHDLARIELAAAGAVCALDFPDFDIYPGDTTMIGGYSFAAANYVPLQPSVQFATVVDLLSWMIWQTSAGNIYADPSGIVHVVSIASTRAVDHAYDVSNAMSCVPGAAPGELLPASINTVWPGRFVSRPWPMITDADYAARWADYQGVDASLQAFLAVAEAATWWDLTVPLNPIVRPGHRVTFVGQDRASRTGVVTGITHAGNWDKGFTTLLALAVMP